jgi:DcrB
MGISNLNNMVSIGEGSINIPAGWHNASVNIFSTSPEGGLNISINRDKLVGKAILNDYAVQQLETLPQQLPQFKLLHPSIWFQPWATGSRVSALCGGCCCASTKTKRRHNLYRVGWRLNASFKNCNNPFFTCTFSSMTR